MNLEDQVCSLELSKRLNELNVKQASLFYWIESEIHTKKIVYVDLLYEEINRLQKIYGFAAYDQYSAFTSSELGEMLPWVIEIDNSYIPVRFCKRKDQYGENLYGINYDLLIVEENAEADARARMIIYLIENGFIKSTSC